MCGICGKVTHKEDSIDSQLITRMAQSLSHRGPDGTGAYIGKNAGLGHRRLSIIDLSQAARQPMPNENETIWVVCNGEIYNFIELRTRLEKKGHKFRSNSDSEVIIHLYEDLSADCVRELRGMFAFAIWDENKKSLFLARDRLGKKPLFYSFKDSNLTFASELIALLEDKNTTYNIDLASIDDFLNYQYIPAPHTIFKEINKLPPAHFLIWKDGKVSIERYWSLDYSKKLNLKEEEYCERILYLLKEATKIRLISDVPLGAFLSGGLDSSAIVAIMSSIMSRPVKTFSIGFNEKSFDETSSAKIISDRFKTEHKEFIVSPNALEVLPKLIKHFGEPYADSSSIPTYYLSKLARQDVTVALNGDGGDESFGGYERYIAHRISGNYRLPFAFIAKLFARGANLIPESTSKKDKINRLKRFLNVAALSPENRYAKLMSTFDYEERISLYSDNIKEEVDNLRRENTILKEYKNSGLSDLTDSAIITDLLTYMPGDLLPKVDITTMMNSLESRSPFLDHQFLEFTAQIPSHLKIKGLTTKYILKKALKDFLPHTTLRKEKMGFGVPVGKWFKNELKKFTHEVLLDSRLSKRGYFKKEKIKELLDNHTSGKINNGAKLWSLLNLELWHRVFIDKERI